MKAIFLLLMLALLPAAAIAAHGDLHCIIIDVPRGEMMLVREEMRLSGVPIAGEDPVIFSTSGNPRELLFRDHASVLEKTRVEMGKGSKSDSPDGRGPNDPGVTLSVQKIRGERDMELRYDVSMMVPTKNGGYYRFATSDQSVPLMFNRWQEVAAWTHGWRTVMLWQFMESRDDPFPDPSQLPLEVPERPVDVKGNYRVDVVIGALPKEVIGLAVDYPAKLAQLTAKQYMNGYGEWKTYGLHCRSGVPFFSQSGGGEQSRIAQPNYDENSISTLDGMVSLRDDGKLAFEGKLKAPKVHDGPSQVYDFSGESKIGEWKFLSLPGGPVATTNLPFLVSWQERCVKQTAQVNMVAFRVVPVVAQ